MKETPTEKYLREILELLRLQISQPIFPPYNGCPPHNMIPFQYQGTWGGSIPPPTMKCTKCLITS